MRELRIADLRHRVTLEEVSYLDDGGGGAQEVWTALGVMWAHIKPVSGSEDYEAERERGEKRYELYMRYRADISPKHRFRYDGRIFEIIATLNLDQRSRWLKCDLREKDI